MTSKKPPSPRRLRPELPAELSALIEQLLEKEPDRRPKSAAQVVEALLRIAAGSGMASVASAPVAGSTSDAQSPSEAPTGSWPALPPGSAAAGQPIDPAQKQRRRFGLIAVAVVGAAAALWGSFREPAEISPAEISVLVLSPEISGPGSEPLALVASGVRTTALGTLASLEGISPIEAHGDSPPSAFEAAWAEAAGELLRSEITPVDGLVRIVLERVDAATGQVLATESLEVSPLPRHARDLADRLRAELGNIFGEYPAAAGRPRMEVSEGSYRLFLELRRRSDAGEKFNPPALERLAESLEESPAFFEGYLFAAYLAANLGQPERAMTFIERAAYLAPEDPRLLHRKFVIEVGAGWLARAERTLQDLEGVVPGDILVLVSRAELYERRGKLDQARQAWATVVELRPSWQNLLKLADAEYQLGQVEESRQHLATLLKRSPGNRFGLERRARLELFYGDLQTAQEIYLRLIEAYPERSSVHLVNLGLARYLLGLFREAEDSYRRAMENRLVGKSLGDFLLRLNLANALSAQGRAEMAAELYRDLLTDLEERRRTAEPSAYEGMIEGQCLARLGDSRGAVSRVQETLERHRQSAEVFYLASLVYALNGDRTHALLYGGKALAGGTRPRWFRVPAFNAFAGDPELEELLAAAVGS